MEVINFDEHPSLVSRYMEELRDVTVQNDPMRFRINLERIGLEYKTVTVTTPLGEAECHEPADQVVLATILRAGLPFHHGFLSYFDHAENAFVSAYRRYREKGDTFDIVVEYLASPSIEGKTLIIVDPMLATGSSMELAYKALLQKGTPAKIHIASVVRTHFPQEKSTLWCGAIDKEINAHSYIVPGLGDAGDLAYGQKD